MEKTIHDRKAVIDLIDATCTSCAIAIEHAGRRLPGVTEIYVDRATSTVQVEYDGESEVLDQICTVVARIGYEARIRSTDPAGATE
jgi:copper chaperone CopZ